MRIKSKVPATGNIMESVYIKYLKPAVLMISIGSVAQWLSLSVGPAVVWWAINLLILYCFYRLLPTKTEYRPIQLRWWLVLVFVNVGYGVFMAENYWDWKNLINNTITFLMPCAALVFYQPNRLGPILSYWLKYALWIFAFLAPFMGSDAIGRYLVPFCFLALFFPILPKKLKLCVLGAFAITILIGQDSRSDMLKFCVSILLAYIAHWKWFLKKSEILLNSIRFAGFLLPIVLLILGFTGIFNIFQIQETLGVSDEEYTITNTSTGEKISMAQDTRTFLYIEEAESAINHNYVLQGRSMARGCDSPFFAWMIDDQLSGDYHPGERASSEVSILNVFNYFGLIGVFLYFLIFWNAVKLAISDSNNIYIKVIGLYVTFRWTFAFVEDFSRFDLNMLFLWIMIGICYSPYWRGMTDNEIKQWVNTL